MIDSKLLKLKIREHKYTISKFSRLVGMDASTFYRKIKSDGFDIKEARTIATLLNLKPKEFDRIFFNQNFA